MQALVCGFPDMAYFGAPILAAMFGAEGFLAVLVGNLITSIFMLPLTIVLTHVSDKQEAGHGWQDFWHVLATACSARSSIRSSAAGSWVPVLSFAHVTLPSARSWTSVDMIAKAAGGTSLFALGLMLYGEHFRINANVLTNLGLKNLLMPVLMVVGGRPVRRDRHRPSAGDQSPVPSPTATAASMFALRNNTYTADATGDDPG